MLLGGLLVGLLAGSGCSTARVGMKDSGSLQNESHLLQGPGSLAQETGNPASGGSAPLYGPAPIQEKPITLVLGGGLARGYSFLGVLQALKQAKVQVAAIYGRQMGAVVGALYGLHGNVNELEWGLLKLKLHEVYRPKTGFLFAEKRLERNSSALQANLSRVFGQKQLSQMKIPVHVSVFDPISQRFSLIQDGSCAAVLAQTWEEEASGSDPGSGDHALVREARSAALGSLVVLVEGIEQTDPNPGTTDDLRFADLVIRPKLNGIGELDFQKATQAALLGKKATQMKLKELFQLMGRTQNDQGWEKR
ncbi:MAG: patatin-like phospholipase family protein [Bdellovibrionia bacterium]